MGGPSHSIAIMADAFNNLSDAGSSLILLFDSVWQVRSRIRSIPLVMGNWTCSRPDRIDDHYGYGGGAYEKLRAEDPAPEEVI